jgi:hypothetical protein
MGVAYNCGSIVTSGLVLALDGANYKSFKGEATTNLIPSPTVNAYPTTGNGWGTYNTNQYNGAQYFSIGSIVSVSGNVITTSGNHPLRTYDVMNPQTTGGGVTAGTNYFIKKVSSTSFTLHAYNGSQDGSQGYISPSTGTHKVYDSIATDTRISVNSTSFPTMWWGAPHLPNSGLVKELRYGEFNAIPNLPANDCIRLHYIRTDDVKDGMSYGVDCTVTPSSPVTVSFYTRAVNANAVGKVVQYYTYNYTGGSATAYAMNFTLGAVGVWERQTFTFTPAYGTMISYWFPQSSGTYAWDWSCMQVEQKSYVTNFVAGTRGTTVATGGGWEDLIGNGNNGELVNGPTYSSANGGSLVFDGTDDYITIPFNASTMDFSLAQTICMWIKPTTGSNTARRNPYNQAYGGPGTLTYETDGTISYYFGTNGGNSSPYVGRGSGFTIAANETAFISVTRNQVTNVCNWYKNGVLITTSDAGGYATTANGTSPIWIGDGYVNGFLGNIYDCKVYNRALTASEIQQNYNALKSRYL